MHRRKKTLSTLSFVALLALTVAAQQTPKPPGRLIDLGGHRLHVYCTGKGPYTAVVENGLGDFSFTWILVQQKVEKFTRICTYDRAGYAWSDPGPKPRTFAQLNLELHDALSKLGERGPLILVGHSFGGGVVRNYATTYPSQVAGMVLVDIVPEDQRIPMGPHAARIRDFARNVPIPAPRENLLPTDKPAAAHPDASLQKLEPPMDKLPPEQQRLQLWAQNLLNLEDAESSQKEWSSEYMAQMHATPQQGILGNIPLIVLTRAEGYRQDLDVPAAELEAERKRTQAQLTLLSTNGKQIIVPSGHNMHLEAPDAVADAIQDIKNSCEHPKQPTQ
jgi:pimeloyl-ACP methyl ester carboxylesterase